MAWSKWWASTMDSVLDPTVVWSFSQPGFHRHAAQFNKSDLSVDLRGKRVLVTGANSGIGKATATSLARLGAEIIMLCRSLERGQTALEEIKRETQSTTLELVQLDVSSKKDIRHKAQGLLGKPIDVLVHNAGVLPNEHSVTSEGLESTLATNLVGPHLLTQCLRPCLSGARVIWVSSGGMYPVKIDLDELVSPPVQKFDGVRAYAQTKRAQVILNELYAERETGWTSLCMHPGWADTPAVSSSIPTFHRLTKSILRTPQQGADTVIWLAAAAKSFNSGTFWFDRKIRRTHAFPWTKETKATQQDLWKLLEELSR